VKHLQKAGGGRKAVIMLIDAMENAAHIKFEDLRRLIGAGRCGLLFRYGP
jgi:hypothetical protein